MTLIKVAITGMGIVSSIGTGLDAVLKALKEGKSGIKFAQDFAQKQMRSQVAGLVDLDLKDVIDRRVFRFMGEAAGYAYVAMQEAIKNAGMFEDIYGEEHMFGLMVNARDNISLVDAIKDKGHGFYNFWIEKGYMKSSDLSGFFALIEK